MIRLLQQRGYMSMVAAHYVCKGSGFGYELPDACSLGSGDIVT